MTLSRGILILWLSVSLLSVAQRAAVAQELINREYDLKATYLYNFGRYIQWPVIPDPFVIGVLGKSPFGAQLAQIESRATINGKRIVVQRFNSINEYQPCQILFISRFPAEGRGEETVEQRLQAALAKTKGTPVLLVGDSPGLAQKGAGINFWVDSQDNLVKMEINPDAVARAGMKISAPLLGLRVVTLVKDGG